MSLRDDEELPVGHGGLSDGEEPECCDDHHAFVGCEAGTFCMCGAEMLTEAEVKEAVKSPMGFLIANGFALQVCPN